MRIHDAEIRTNRQKRRNEEDEEAVLEDELS
jgi:hypothetical protein